MNVTYTTRGFNLSHHIRKFTEEKIESLDDLIDVNLTLEHARHLFKAELLVHNRNARFTGVEQTPDVFKSINAVIDKVQKQLKRHKEKLIGRKRKAPAKEVKLVQNMAVAERTSSPRVIRSRKPDVRPMSQDEALMQLNKSKDAFLIFRDVSSDRIHILHKRKDGNYSLIDSEI